MPEYQYRTDFELRVGLIEPLKADRKSNTWLTVKYDPPFGSDKTVVVIPMTQTYNGPDTPGLRLRNVTPSSFEIRFDEVYISTAGGQYSADGLRVHPESVGWVAYGFRK
jgi:hypothetical protein